MCLETVGEHERPAMWWHRWNSTVVPDVFSNKAHDAPIKGLTEDEREQRRKRELESYIYRSGMDFVVYTSGTIVELQWRRCTYSPTVFRHIVAASFISQLSALHRHVFRHSL